MSPTATIDALDRARELLLEPDEAELRDGYLDAFGETPPPQPSAAQRAMNNPLLPFIYERAWRPIGATLAAASRGTGDEERLTRELLDLGPDDTVLDVACGPGNITRRLLGELGPDGLAVGFDAAPGMLARAVAETADERAAFVRGNAMALPFLDSSFDAVSCFAALYMLDDPDGALAEMTRVLAPGGRLAILTSVYRGLPASRPLQDLAVWPSGIRMFGRDEVTGSLRRLGLVDVRQEVRGFAQFVGARKVEAVS